MKHFARMMVAACLVSAGLMPVVGWAGPFYGQTNLVTDDQTNLPADAQARFVDTNLVNPWGISKAPGGPFWVSDNNSGNSTLYNGAGKPQALVVSIPFAAGQTPPNTQGSPTGNVFNPANAFGPGPKNFKGDAFIFASEDGTISGWQGGTAATVRVAGDPANSNVYKGLAIAKSGGASFIYAANFRTGFVDMYDTNFNLVKSFTDGSLPAGYAPFGIQEINGKLYVTYALQKPSKHDDQEGDGHGFVDVFNNDGTLAQQLIAHGALNSPWGLALAPSTFGTFGGDLLVGNFGNSWINAFDPTTGTFLGTLSDSNGNPLSLTYGGEKGLWGIKFGDGGKSGGDPNSLFFASGINDEANGLFGKVDFIPEPGTLTLCLLGAVCLGVRRWKKARAAARS